MYEKGNGAGVDRARTDAPSQKRRGTVLAAGEPQIVLSELSGFAVSYIKTFRYDKCLEVGMRAEFLRGKRKEELKKKEERPPGSRGRRLRKVQRCSRSEEEVSGGDHREEKGAKKKILEAADHENRSKKKQGSDLHYQAWHPASHMRIRLPEHPKLETFASQYNHKWDHLAFYESLQASYKNNNNLTRESFPANGNLKSSGSISWANTLTPSTSTAPPPPTTTTSLAAQPKPALSSAPPPKPSTPQTSDAAGQTHRRLSVITSTSNVQLCNEVKTIIL